MYITSLYCMYNISCIQLITVTDCLTCTSMCLKFIINQIISNQCSKMTQVLSVIALQLPEILSTLK